MSARIEVKRGEFIDKFNELNGTSKAADLYKELSLTFDINNITATKELVNRLELTIKRKSILPQVILLDDIGEKVEMDEVVNEGGENES